MGNRPETRLPGGLPSQADDALGLIRYREHFPILARTTYLISNSLGAVPAAVADSLQSYFEAWASRGVRAWEDSCVDAEFGTRVTCSLR